MSKPIPSPLQQAASADGMAGMRRFDRCSKSVAAYRMCLACLGVLAGSRKGMGGKCVVNGAKQMTCKKSDWFIVIDVDYFTYIEGQKNVLEIFYLEN